MDFISTHITEKPIDILKAIEGIQDTGHGAIATFIGTVRDHHNGKKVTGITYDVHETLAEKVLREICHEAARKWPDTRYYAVHFVGKLLAGGISIIVAVSSPHRAESFDACRYVIEAIKKKIPIWKKEHYEDGHSDWLPGYSLINNDAYPHPNPSTRTGIVMHAK